MISEKYPRIYSKLKKICFVLPVTPTSLMAIMNAMPDKRLDIVEKCLKLKKVGLRGIVSMMSAYIKTCAIKKGIPRAFITVAARNGSLKPLMTFLLNDISTTHKNETHHWRVHAKMKKMISSTQLSEF